MPYHGSGCYAPNEGPVDVGRVVEIVASPVGDGAVVLMAHQAGKNDALKKLREAMPDAVIQIRRYVADWTSETPHECADRFIAAMEACRPWTDHGTWANEQNLASESAWKIGASPTRLMPWSEWQRVAAYNEIVATEVRRLAPWIVLHYPGFAYGHGEDWGYDEHHNPLPGFPVVDGVATPAYELCRAGIAQCHVLNHHPYVQRGAPILDEWVGVRRIEKTIALFPGKTIFVAETGDFDVSNPQAPDRILQIAYYLQGRPEVLGWCFFILDSPDPAHNANNWSLNRAIEAAYRGMTRVPRPRSWSAPEEQPMPTLKGIDVSNNQGTINWAQVKASGVEFAMIKASGDEGPTNVYLDGYFPRNWLDAGAVPMVRGAYHYARPSAVSPSQSVTTFQRALQAVGGLKAGDLIALDIEDPDVGDGTNLHVWVAEWLSLAEQVFGVAAFKYSGRYYTSTHDLEHVDLERFPTWWASWQPTKPAAVTGWAPITIWQTSDKGSVPGVTGACDMNVFEGSVADLRAFGLRSPAPTPVPTPPPTPPPTPTPGIPDLTERTYGLAHQIRALSDEWRAAGYPQAAEGIDAGANAVERFVSIAGKGEK